MRRLLAMLGTFVLVLVGGCGQKSYELRLDKTLEEMKYQDRLNRMLMAPAKGKLWETNAVYVRAPKNLAEVDLMLAPPDPGKFDIQSSFIDQKNPGLVLHVLARIKRPKNTKKKQQTPADTADRKDFNADLIEILAKSYPIPPDEISIAKFKQKTEKNNDYKRYSFTVNNQNVDRNVEVYLYKKDAYDVVLIFDYPKAEQANVTSKDILTLESFAVGPKAQRLFSGGSAEEEPAGQGGGGGAPVVF